MPQRVSSVAQTDGRRTSRFRGDDYWPLSVEQYHLMIDHGILTGDDPVELLEGLLVRKMPKKPAHRLVTRRLRQALEGIVGSGWHVDCQEPVTLAHSEPEPDLSVIRGRDEEFHERHPGPGDIGMVVEVADTTLKRDRGSKKRAYAGAGIPIYWIVNIAARTIEVYSDPSGPAKTPTYRQRQDFKAGDSLAVILGGKHLRAISVSSIVVLD